MDRLVGKTAFITGAGAGIARAGALVFAREGAQVVIAEINPEWGRDTEQIVLDAGGSALFVETDVTSSGSVRAAIAAAVERFGKINILYNCAGGALSADKIITEVDLDAVWGHTMMLDLYGTMICCRHVIPELIKAGGGTVVNMSSGAALRGAAPEHVYTAAKGGILSLTRALAGTYVKQGVRVNAICAGRILTEKNIKRYGLPGEIGYGTQEGLGRISDPQDAASRLKDYPLWAGKPEDIANIALFLASDESRMVTGATIPADGGRSAY